MKITKATISKTQLAKMPEMERVALILMGHAFNEINVLRKLLISTLNFETPAEQIIDRVQGGQVVIVMRMLMGKCFEAWLMFTARVQPLRSKYLPKLADREKVETTLKELNVHFNDGRMAAIRNQLAFHHRDDQNLVETHWQKVDERDFWEIYLHDRNVNTFYYLSELIITMILTQLALPATSQGGAGHGAEIGFREAIDLNNKISGKLLLVLDALIAAISGENIPDLTGEEIDIGDAAKPSQLSLPFFWDENDYVNFMKSEAGT